MLKTYKLSNAQKRIWYAQKKYKESSLFNIGGTVQINGKPDIHILKKVIMQVIERNEGLHFEFYEEKNEVYSYIHHEHLYIEYKDFSLLDNKKAVFDQWCREEAGTCFAMIKSPLYKFVIYKLSEEWYGYFIKIHHIIADGWSIKLFTDQVAESYESIIKNMEIPHSVNASYLEYILEEELYLYSDKGQADKTFWLDMYSTIPENPSISSDLLKGKRMTYIVEDTLMSDISAYMKRQKITLNVFFVVVYLLYAYKKWGKSDQVLGIPLLGRMSKKERETFGNFTNTMPYRYRINSNLSIDEVMQEVRGDLKQVYKHQKYPYNELCKDIRLYENEKDRLYDVCINYYNTTLSNHMDQIEVENTEFYNGQQEYALQIILRHWNNVKLQMDFDYQQAVYSENIISDIYKEFQVLIKKIVEHRTLTVKELNLLRDEEYNRVIYDFNKTDISYLFAITWMDLFQTSVLSFAERTAVSKGEEEITYEELDKKSDVWASYFSRLGVKKGDIVAIIPEYDIASITSIIGIIKVGAVYLPIEKKLPHGRKSAILMESGAKYLAGSENDIEFSGLFIQLTENIKNQKRKKRPTLPSGQDLAYMIYTSGSTGVPKGVMVTHKNLVNYLMWAKDTYIRGEKEVFPLFSSFSFDFTVTSLFLPLICGGEIRLYENMHDSNIFRRILWENKATILKITPSHIPLIADVPVSRTSIHTLILGGENLKTEACKKLDRHFDGETIIYNEYGPTEATVGCMIYQYNKEDKHEFVSIGIPVFNTKIYILDKDLQPVPPNTVGEIYIGGAGVTKGYYKREMDTKAKFISNPFVSGEIIYKTGDLAICHEDGKIYYYGRVDNELKIRGNRVNLSEIENKIMDTRVAVDVVVKPVGLHKDGPLCAYLLSQTDINLEVLKEELKDKLPDYMLPGFYITLPEFPLTVNGKVDTDRLPLPPEETVSDIEIKPSEELGQLLAIAEELFCIEEKILPESNFFLLGGDSIKAVQISSHMYEKGYELSVKDILENPLFYKMAKAITQKKYTVYEQGICSGEIERLPIIKWFHNQKFKVEGHYNLSVLLELKKEIPDETFNDIFLYLINHHDALRINYSSEREILFYNNKHLEQKNIIRVLRLKSGNYNVSMEMLTKQYIDPLFDIENDLLIRPYFILKGNKRYLLIMTHHLVMDAISLHILLEDIQKLLTLSKESYFLPEKTASYAQFAKSFLKWSQYKGQYIPKWNTEQACLVTHHGKNKNSVSVLRLEISEKISQYLQQEANDAYHTKPNELQIIALVLALYDITHKESFCIQSESHGRNLLEDLNTNRTIGWFTILYPLCLTVNDLPLKEQIEALRDQIRHREKKCYEFGILKYLREEPLRETDSICFNYLGEYVEKSNEYYAIKQIFNSADRSSLNHLPYTVEVNTVICQKKLKIFIRYRDSEIEEDVVSKMAEGFQSFLEEIVMHCINKKEKVITPEEFSMVDLTDEELDNLFI